MHGVESNERGNVKELRYVEGFPAADKPSPAWPGRKILRALRAGCRRPGKPENQIFSIFLIFSGFSNPGEAGGARGSPGDAGECWGETQSSGESSGELRRAPESSGELWRVLESPREQRGATGVDLS